MFLTLDDYPLRGKCVFVRTDMNCPIDPKTGTISDSSRIKSHLDTFSELSEKGARSVIASHQGRPGDSEFVSLREHAEKISEFLGREVGFCDSPYGSSLRQAVLELKDGDLLVMENVRFLSEELLSRPPSVLAKSHFVQSIAPLFSYFVNDAFAVGHRSQASIVGLGEYMPTLAGRLVEREVAALSELDSSEEPPLYILGGVKLPESVLVMRRLLENGRSSCILTGGVLGSLILQAQGYDLGPVASAAVQLRCGKRTIHETQDLLREFPGKIVAPLDVAVLDETGDRYELDVSELPTPLPIFDVGEKTAELYRRKVLNAPAIVANSPLGVYENPKFQKSTKIVLDAIADRSVRKFICGGHLSDVASRCGHLKRFDHVSVGGRATLTFLAGERMPLLTLLEESHRKYSPKSD